MNYFARIKGPYPQKQFAMKRFRTLKVRSRVDFSSKIIIGSLKL